MRSNLMRLIVVTGLTVACYRRSQNYEPRWLTGYSRIMQKMSSTASQTLTLQLEHSRKINELLQGANFLHEVDAKVSEIHRHICQILQILEGPPRHMALVEDIADGVRRQELQFESMDSSSNFVLELR